MKIAQGERSAVLGRGHAPASLPFPEFCFFPGLRPGKKQNSEPPGGIYFGLLTQGGAPLALGWYAAAPLGRRRCAESCAIDARRGKSE